MATISIHVAAVLADFYYRLSVLSKVPGVENEMNCVRPIMPDVKNTK